MLTIKAPLRYLASIVAPTAGEAATTILWILPA